MKKKSFNPFKLWGTYAGMLIGVYATYKETNPFSFLDSVFNFLRDSNIELNIVGGFFVGYALHLFIRSMINSSKRGIDSLRQRKLK